MSDENSLDADTSRFLATLRSKKPTKVSQSSPPPKTEGAKERRKKKEQIKIKKRMVYRASYDLPPGMKDRIAEIAEQNGTTATQVAACLLADALKRFDAGEVHFDKVPSSSLRYDYNLVIDWDSSSS